MSTSNEPLSLHNLQQVLIQQKEQLENQIDIHQQLIDQCRTQHSQLILLIQSVCVHQWGDIVSDTSDPYHSYCEQYCSQCHLSRKVR